MDWIKVLTKHIIYEYRDLRDSEFAAWVKIMALTAHLEHIPSRKQMLGVANYQTIDSLERKLKTHYHDGNPIDLPYVLHKVLIDVSYVSHRREQLKLNTQRYRDKSKAVIDDVMITSSTREDKIREEPPIVPQKTGDGGGEEKPKRKKKEKLPIEYTQEFLQFYDAYPRKAAKIAAWTAWKNSNGNRPAIDEIIYALETQKKSQQWTKDAGRYIPYPATWLNRGGWGDELDGQVKGGW